MNLAATILNMIGEKHFPTNLQAFLLTTQLCLQNELCARLYFHLQTVNEGWSTNTSTATEESNDTPMELKAVNGGRRRKDAHSEMQFAGATTAGTGDGLQVMALLILSLGHRDLIMYIPAKIR